MSMNNVVVAGKQIIGQGGQALFLPNTPFLHVGENGLAKALQPLSKATTYRILQHQHPCSLFATDRHYRAVQGAKANKRPAPDLLSNCCPGYYTYLSTCLSHGGALPVPKQTGRPANMPQQEEKSKTTAPKQFCLGNVPSEGLPKTRQVWNLSQIFNGKKSNSSARGRHLMPSAWSCQGRLS
jgi:hypothetical protein